MGNQERQARDDVTGGETDEGAPLDNAGALPAVLGKAKPTKSSLRNVIPMIRKVDVQKKTASADGRNGTAQTQDQVEQRQVADHIGRQLRGMYDGLLNQPVPDRFLDLVRRLETGDQQGTLKK